MSDDERRRRHNESESRRRSKLTLAYEELGSALGFGQVKNGASRINLLVGAVEHINALNARKALLEARVDELKASLARQRRMNDIFNIKSPEVNGASPVRSGGAPRCTSDARSKVSLDEDAPTCRVAASHLWNDAFQRCDTAIAIVEMTGVAKWVNSTCLRLTGWKSDPTSAPSLLFSLLKRADDLANVYSSMKKILKEKETNVRTFVTCVGRSELTFQAEVVFSKAKASGALFASMTEQPLILCVLYPVSAIPRSMCYCTDSLGACPLVAFDDIVGDSLPKGEKCHYITA